MLKKILLLLLLVAIASACLGGDDDGGNGDGDGGNGDDDGGNGDDDGGNGDDDAANDEPADDTGKDDGGGDENPLRDLLDSAESYDESGYADNGGSPVASGEDLACNFDGPCCWKNAQPPEDKIDFIVFKEAPSDEAMEQAGFGTTEKPDGNYLITYTDGSEAVDQARFYSCSIGCTDEEVQVTVSHWSTNDVEMEVCEQESMGGDEGARPLMHCLPLPKQDSPGPTTVALPPGENFDIVIVAKNFVNPVVDAAMIDDIKVEFTPCEEEEPSEDTTDGPPDSTDSTGPPDDSTGPPPGPDADCSTVMCDFTEGRCSYEDGLTGSPTIDTGATTEFEAPLKDRNWNRVTGVRESPPNGAPYAATYQKPEDIASMESSELQDTEDRVLRFDYYEATDDLHMTVCLDEMCEDGIFLTRKEAHHDTLDWQTQSVMVPGGTKKIIFVALNKGKHQGAAAVANIQWLIPDGDNPEDATEDACAAAPPPEEKRARRRKVIRKRRRH